jgi:hypothetical protein
MGTGGEDDDILEGLQDSGMAGEEEEEEVLTGVWAQALEV